MTSLRVGNLPFSAEAEDVTTLFEKYGEVGDVYFPKERDTGRSRGFAFVRYQDKRDAEYAVDGLNGRRASMTASSSGSALTPADQGSPTGVVALAEALVVDAVAAAEGEGGAEADPGPEI